jgi:hypothetical protein
MASDFEETVRQNQSLADQLLAMTADASSSAPTHIPPPLARGLDAIVYAFEINDHHGVGVLVRRIFGEYDNVLSIHAKSLYGGHQDFGARYTRISNTDMTRDAVFKNVLESLGDASVNRVLCIPFLPDDALTAIAIKEAFGIPLCTFLMDDQNLCSDGISDQIMAELLSKSSLRLAISPEMCDGYERKYGCKVWFMPPLAPTHLIPHRLISPKLPATGEISPIILGNIWGQRWVELLRETVRDSGVTVRWHNNGEFRWLPCTKDELVRDGIRPQEGPPPSDEAMVEILRQTPFVLLPSGVLDESDDRRFIAQMSFPSRIPYILATSHTPILVIGHSETAAARLVTRLGIGMVVPYEREAFLRGVSWITRPDVNLAMRRASFLLSVRFADVAAAEWLWQSLAKGAPVDSRYEDLMPARTPAE